MTLNRPNSTRTAIATALLIVAVFIVSGWQGGNVSSSTLSAIAFTNQATAAVSSNFQNIGAVSHWLTYCDNAGVSSIKIQLEGSYDNVTFFAISAQGTQNALVTAQCAVLEAGGYFPYVRANLVSINGSVSAFYSASAFPIPGGGVSQLGKTPQPVSYAPTITGQCVIDNTSSCFPISTVQVPAGAVLYGITLTNQAASACVVTMFTPGQNSTQATQIRTIAQNTSVDIPLPTEGMDLGSVGQNQLYLLSGVAPGANTCLATVYYKAVKTSSSKVNSGGAEQNSQRNYP